MKLGLRLLNHFSYAKFQDQLTSPGNVKHILGVLKKLKWFLTNGNRPTSSGREVVPYLLPAFSPLLASPRRHYANIALLLPFLQWPCSLTQKQAALECAHLWGLGMLLNGGVALVSPSGKLFQWRMTISVQSKDARLVALILKCGVQGLKQDTWHHCNWWAGRGFRRLPVSIKTK